MPAEPARRGRHLVVPPAPSKRRHRIFAFARPLENIPARVDRPVDIPGLARHADFLLDDVVIRLKVGQSDGPVFDGGSFGDARRAVALLRLADHLEIPRAEPPALRPIVQRRAAHGVHHRVDGQARRVGTRRARPVRWNFVLRLLHRLRPGAEIVPNFVRGEILRLQPGAGLEADDIDASLSKRQHRHSASSAQSNHDNIGLLQRRHVLLFYPVPTFENMR